MRRATWRPAWLALPLTLVAACGGITETPPTINRYAALNLVSRSAPGGTARGSATLIFFEAVTQAIPSSARQQTDQCVISSLDTLRLPTRGERRHAASPAFTVAGTAVPLAFNDTLTRYQALVVSYRAGDQAQLTLPGDAAVFPAATIAVKLAEPLLPGPVSAPAVGQPLLLTWNGTSDPTASVALSLRYANPPSSPYANEQVYCLLRDDGTQELPAVLLTNFYVSPAANRAVQFSRWRTNEVLPDARSLLHIATSFDTVVAIR